MPDIKLRNQPFDLVFHPQEPVVFSSILTGEVKAFRYDDVSGEASASWSVRPSKRTMRSVAVSEDGQNLWAGGKAGGLFQMVPGDGQMKKERLDAHESPVNRIHCVNENLIATGDDDGVIKFWDPRQEDSIRSYSQHFDYISDFTYFDDKRQLISTSGDGHLSVIDIRSSKPSPMAVSDDQDDELLSIIPIKNGTKCVVGSTLGILSIWDRAKGWGDHVDRVPGHPASIDALVALSPDIIATGSEDGMLRVMQILPHKFLGVIATHEEYPIERIKLDRNKKWLGSVSHDECIKLTDVEDLFEDSDGEDEGMDEDVEDNTDDGNGGVKVEVDEEEGGEDAEEEEDSDESMEEEPVEKKKKKKGRGKAGMGDLGRDNARKGEASFFDDL